MIVPAFVTCRGGSRGAWLREGDVNASLGSPRRPRGPKRLDAFSDGDESREKDADTAPSLHTASNSISFAFLINLDTTTGWSGLTSAASPKKAASSESDVATFIAAPLNTRKH